MIKCDICNWECPHDLGYNYKPITTTNGFEHEVRCKACNKLLRTEKCTRNENGDYNGWECEYCEANICDHNYPTTTKYEITEYTHSKITTCNRCNSVIKSTPKERHTEKTVITSVTSSVHNLKTYCPVCDYTIKTYSLGHEIDTEVIKRPTCNERGENREYCTY
jgi:hypothetical protein